MDWNGKWDWENFISFGAKPAESPKRQAFGDLLIDGSASSFNLPDGCRGLDDDEAQNKSFRLMSEGHSSTKAAADDLCAASLVAEPVIGLKLGKRTYFESSGVASSSTRARSSLSHRSQPIPRCIVEGCGIDLSTAKEYHRKHKVCESHSKCSKVVVGGHERRFCQQCSRFHNLAEFDDDKRSCRRRLIEHNARRRKPQQETAVQINSVAGLPSPFYGGREQMGFLMSSAQHYNPRHYTTTTMWDNNSSSCKFTINRGIPMKSDRGSKESMSGNHMEAAAAAGPEYGRALSLLSTNSWGACGAESLPVHYQEGIIPCATEPMMHGLTGEEGLPLSSGEFLLPVPGHHHHHQHSSIQTRDAQEIQVFRTTHQPDFYPHTLN